MKLCTAVQEDCGYKDTLCAHQYFAPLAKHFTVCITYQPALVHAKQSEMTRTEVSKAYPPFSGFYLTVMRV
jgi:hypothetical protein